MGVTVIIRFFHKDREILRIEVMEGITFTVEHSETQKIKVKTVESETPQYDVTPTVESPPVSSEEKEGEELIEEILSSGEQPPEHTQPEKPHKEEEHNTTVEDDETHKTRATSKQEKVKEILEELMDV